MKLFGDGLNWKQRFLFALAGFCIYFVFVFIYIEVITNLEKMP